MKYAVVLAIFDKKTWEQKEKVIRFNTLNMLKRKIENLDIYRVIMITPIQDEEIISFINTLGYDTWLGCYSITYYGID